MSLTIRSGLPKACTERKLERKLQVYTNSRLSREDIAESGCQRKVALNTHTISPFFNSTSVTFGARSAIVTSLTLTFNDPEGSQVSTLR